MLGRVLQDFEGPEMILALQHESSAVGACGVALLVVFWYSPRVRALPTSPELELAGIGNFILKLFLQ